MRRLALALVVVLAGCAGQVRPLEIPAATTPLGPAPALTGSLTLPGGTAPFPIVVLLHGCGGLGLTTHRATWNLLHEYAGWYAARGFAALVLDSLTPRGVPHVCTGGAPYPAIRALDVYRAVEHLGRQGVADPTRAVVQGLSHGGSTVLAAMDEQIAELAGTPLRLRGGIAYYPACAGATSRAFYGPVLILIGEKDDWTPAGPCERLHAEQQQRVPGRVRLIVYPGALHSFDFNFPPRLNEYGKTVGYDGAATRDAERRVEAFLAEVVGRPR